MVTNYSAIIIFCQEKSAPVRRGTLRSLYEKVFLE
nr:MAG TPA: hypothetical protein [Caudoviricetes sp.]